MTQQFIHKAEGVWLNFKEIAMINVTAEAQKQVKAYFGGKTIQPVRIHVHPRVEKRISRMETQEKAPSIAAKRARAIIQMLLKGIQPSQAGRLSKKKDARIENLFKFDLGSGYRLVCVREQDSIYILYMGSHDNCDTWLDANSRKKPHKADVYMNIYNVNPPPVSRKMNAFMDELDVDPLSMIEISQKDLKAVFKGIVNDR